MCSLTCRRRTWEVGPYKEAHELSAQLVRKLFECFRDTASGEVYEQLAAEMEKEEGNPDD